MKHDRHIVEFRGELKDGEELEIIITPEGEIISADHRTFEIILELADEINSAFGPIGLCG